MEKWSVPVQALLSVYPRWAVHSFAVQAFGLSDSSSRLLFLLICQRSRSSNSAEQIWVTWFLRMGGKTSSELKATAETLLVWVWVSGLLKMWPRICSAGVRLHCLDNSKLAQPTWQKSPKIKKFKQIDRCVNPERCEMMNICFVCMLNVSYLTEAAGTR